MIHLDIKPTTFPVGHFQIGWYGLFIGLGMAVALWLTAAIWLNQRSKSAIEN